MKLKHLFILSVILICTHGIFAQTIHDAIKNGNLEQVKSLIEKESQLLTQKYNTETPVRFMPTEVSPLFDAVLYGRSEIIRLLIEKGVDLKNDNYAIFLALLQKGKKIKRLLIDNGARITNDTAACPQPNILTKAVWFYPEYTQIHEELIKLGAGVNLDWGEDGNYTHTPLGMATRLMLPGVVKLLVENGAKMNLERNNGQIGLHDAIFYAAQPGLKHGYSPECLNYLLENGGNKNHRDNNGNLPVEYAAIEGVTMALKILWENNYDVTCTNYDGMTLLHRTVIRGYYENVKFLISKGFNPNAKDNYGHTPLFYAYRYGHQKIAALLKNNGGKTGYMPDTEEIASLLKKELKNGQAYIWYLGRQGWAIKTKNNLVLKPMNFGEKEPDNPSLANGQIVADELIEQNVLLWESEEFASKLVAEDAHLKTKSPEKNIFLFSNETPKSQHLNTVKFKANVKNEIGSAVIHNDIHDNWLIIADGVKILFSGYKKSENEELNNAADNLDIAFFSIWGSRGELPLKTVQNAEENIKVHQPNVLFHHSIYTRSYFHQELSRQLKERGCKIHVPVAKFPGDRFFYDSTQSILLSQ
jgi:ankyrin repeat protein